MPPEIDEHPGPPATTADPIVFFDGECGLCNWYVAWLLKADRERVFRFAPFQGESARLYLGDRVDRARDSIVLIDGDGEHWRSDALLAIHRRLGGLWRVAVALERCIPRPVRDWGYVRIARNRHALSPKTACRLLSPDEQARILK